MADDIVTHTDTHTHTHTHTYTQEQTPRNVYLLLAVTLPPRTWK